jgi:hypothetical protein
MPDADKYYSENSQIISTEKPADSVKLRSASQVYSDFSERGFTSGLTVTYTIDGEFLNEESVSSYSNKKYPIYNTVYVTASGDIWVIFEINGTICANPVSKNLTSDTPTVITETDTVMSYDSTLNKFYETVPERDAVRTVKVERIDAITLESGVF